MDRPYTRRQLLQAGAVGSTVGLAGCSSFGSDARGNSTVSIPETADGTHSGNSTVDVQGANYLPARAFNTFQLWWRYDPAVVERDLEYATRVNLNAIRTWTSYEWWSMRPERHARDLEHLLSTAAANGLGVVLCLFEGIGTESDPEERRDTDLESATAVASPATDVVTSETLWDRTREYVAWVMDRYRDDDRLLALSVMNEPGWSDAKTAFAESMFRTMVDRRGSVPLSVGSTSLTTSLQHVEWGADVVQFHYNFVKRPARFRRLLWEANHLSEAIDKRIWLTEWQRFRTSEERDAEYWRPNYASTAAPLRDAGVGNFFWSLMLKPAYTPPQRRLGAINGLFHEDGAVWSRADARAIKAMSGDPSFSGEQRQEIPDWMRPDPSETPTRTATPTERRTPTDRRTPTRTETETPTETEAEADSGPLP